jgi:hypothetical protein
MGEFGTVLDRLQQYFGKAYFYAGVLPAFILILLTFWLFSEIVPGSQSVFHGLEEGTAVTKAAAAALGVALIGIVGIVFWNLNGWFLSVLKLEFLPDSLRRRLATANVARFNELVQLATDGRRRLYFLRDLNKNGAQILKRARAIGITSGNATVSNAQAVESVSLLIQMKNQAQDIPIANLKEAFEAVRRELEVTDADRSKELDYAQVAMNEVVEYAEKLETEKTRTLYDELFRRFPGGTGNGATRIALLSPAARNYASEKYGFDLEDFWLILLLSLPKDAAARVALEESRTRYEFTIGLTLVAGVLTLESALVNLLFGANWVFAALTVGLSTIGFFAAYEATVQTLYMYQQVVKSIVDLHRWEILKAFGLTLPKSPGEELRLFANLASWKESLAFQ